MPLGIAVVLILSLWFIYAGLKLVYIDIRYHFTEVAYDAMWWIIGISAALLLKWLFDKSENKNNTPS